MTRLFPDNVIGIGMREIRMTHAARRKLFGRVKKIEIVLGSLSDVQFHQLEFSPCDKFHGHQFRQISRNCCAVLLPVRLRPWPDELRGRYMIHIFYSLRYVDLTEKPTQRETL